MTMPKSLTDALNVATSTSLSARPIADYVVATLAPILPGVKVRVRVRVEGYDSEGRPRVQGGYDIQVEAPPEVQKMFHVIWPDTEAMTHCFHNYADTFDASVESAKIMVQQMAFDYETFRRTGSVENKGHA